MVFTKIISLWVHDHSSLMKTSYCSTKINKLEQTGRGKWKSGKFTTNFYLNLNLGFDILLQKKVDKRGENFIKRYRREVSFLISMW